MAIELKLVFKYRPSKYKQTFSKRANREFFQINRAAAWMMIRKRGSAMDLPGSIYMDVGLENYIEGLGCKLEGWMTANIQFSGDFWTDQNIIEFQQHLIRNNKKILLTQLTSAKRTGTIPPCETPSTDPTDLPAVMCPTS